MIKKTEKPFAPACERNQQVILEVIKQYLRSEDKKILEVGSGTGQHAVYMAKHLPHVLWQPSDVLANHQGINLWRQEAGLNNVAEPLVYEIGKNHLPEAQADVIFTANTLHIMSLKLVNVFLKEVGENLKPGGRLLIYGPFKYKGQFTTDSNAEFDLWLKNIDSNRGIRDYEHICEKLKGYNIHNIADISMPANNQFLLFEKHD
ncbi:MAG: DUF938 domain-containing protein [Xanthomonadales bacterium]|nr:DUF938 domain-containing protein [Xanthomonadales bacterium]